MIDMCRQDRSALQFDHKTVSRPVLKDYNWLTKKHDAQVAACYCGQGSSTSVLLAGLSQLLPHPFEQHFCGPGHSESEPHNDTHGPIVPGGSIGHHELRTIALTTLLTTRPQIQKSSHSDIYLQNSLYRHCKQLSILHDDADDADADDVDDAAADAAADADDEDDDDFADGDIDCADGDDDDDDDDDAAVAAAAAAADDNDDDDNDAAAAADDDDDDYYYDYDYANGDGDDIGEGGGGG
ncbi:hypothetical protein DPMN_076874 [Dreissena polymorpha]|uniref:Uncharacterized protein n=1 Tax=Dreissena polymorpha TaxID=45954 RepID=A0A9D3YPH1_DREPO|nr:hypothetical protein DPMN_076874 [Dreissena polymorpha]